jgi:hypothetical protein|nr:MAG TPA: baseplate protein [Caudoviricetes sp.]
MVINIKFHAADNSLLLLSNNNEPGKTTCLITFENVTANTAQIVFGSYTGPVTEVVNGSISLDVSGQIFSWPSAKTCYLIDTQTHGPITFQGGGTYNASDNLMIQEKDGVYYFERVLEDLRISNIINLIYPVGSVYTSVSDRNPSIWLGGTWVSFGSGRTLVGVDTGQSEFNSVEKPGGHKELQSHAHGLNNHVHSLNNHTHNVPNHVHTMQGSGNHFHYLGINKSAVQKGTSYNKPNNYESGSTSYKSNTTGNHTHTMNSSGNCTTGANNGNTGGNSGNTTSSGGGNAGNLQPYITVFFWKRTK